MAYIVAGSAERKGPMNLRGPVWLSICLVFSLALPSSAEGPSRKERHRWGMLAQEAQQAKNYSSALEFYEKATQPGAADKDLLRWWPQMGRCYEALENYQKALTAYQSVSDRRPKNVDAMLDLARVYAWVDLNDQAIGLYKKVLSRDKHRADVVFALGALYFKAGQLDSARAEIEKYLNREPRDLGAQKLMAQILESLGEIEPAAHLWETVLAIEPSGPGFFHMGQLWSRANESDLAARAFEKAEKLNFDSSAFNVERGLLAWRQSLPEQAAQFWRKALDEQNDLSTAQFLLALNDYQKGNKSSALEQMGILASGPAGLVKDLSERFVKIVGGNKLPVDVSK
jgi:tetratricopeptide (TPR) repeat protein